MNREALNVNISSNDSSIGISVTQGNINIIESIDGSSTASSTSTANNMKKC
jgi:hypothetical protein